MSQGAFLGLFAWQIVHWVLKLDSWGLEIAIPQSIHYSLDALGVLNTAFESDLVFVDQLRVD